MHYRPKDQNSQIFQKGIIQKFASVVLNNHKVIVIGTIILTAFLGFFIKDIQTQPDIMSYMPKNDSLIKLFDYIGKEYGGNLIAMIVLETDDVFNLKTLNHIAQLTEQFQNLEGVQSVTSLTNILNIKMTDEGLEIGPLIDTENPPGTRAELKKLKAYTLYVGEFYKIL